MSLQISNYPYKLHPKNEDKSSKNVFKSYISEMILMRGELKWYWRTKLEMLDY